MSAHEPMSAEARALHAVLDDDHDEAARIRRGFLPGELRALERACGELGALGAEVRRDPMQVIESGAPDAFAVPPATVDVTEPPVPPSATGEGTKG
jgi:hypothetical protein